MARVNLDGNYISIYFGHTRHSNESLTLDPYLADDHTWYFAHTPVSQKNLRLLGTKSGNNSFIVNYTLEPLTGKLVVDSSLPAYDSIAAWYFSYTDYELDVLTKGWKPISRTPSPEIDIFGKPWYTVHNFYPAYIDFRIVITSEAQRALLTEPMFKASYFIAIDKGIPQEYAQRAYEGPIYSDEQLSMYKGYSNLIPTKLFVQGFGKYTPSIEGPVISFQNPGGGQTNVVAPTHGLSANDIVTITGASYYNGTYVVQAIVDANVFTITKVWSGTEGAWFSKSGEINWKFWENS